MSWEDSVADAEYVPSIVIPQMDDIVRRAFAAGAKPPLEYVGAGMTAVVLCSGKTAFKVANNAERDIFLRDEAEWLETAKKVPWVKDYVARIKRFDPENAVIVRECPTSERYWGGYGEGKLFDLHQEIEKRMIPYGWTSPEFKLDSYVITKDGPVLVDASMPSRVGKRLLDYARDLMRGRRDPKSDYERPSDLAFAVRMEIGRTLAPEEADETLAALAKLEAAGNRWTSTHEMRESAPRRTIQQIEADVRRRNAKIAAFVAANDGRSFSAPTLKTHWPIDHYRKRPIPEFIVVHPDPHHEGGWRFSRFEGVEPRAQAVGHGERARYADAVRDAVRDYGLDLDRATFEGGSREMREETSAECGIAILKHVSAIDVVDSYKKLYASGRHQKLPPDSQYQWIIDRGPRWVLANISLDALDFQTISESGPDRIARAQHYASLPTALPPGTASYNTRSQKRRAGKAYVTDGNHRVLAAEMRGDCAVRMFMQEDEFIAFERDAQWRGLAEQPDSLTGGRESGRRP